MTYFENEIQTAMEDNSTTNNKNDTYASENVYPIDKLQSPIQQAEVEKTFDTNITTITVKCSTDVSNQNRRL